VRRRVLKQRLPRQMVGGTPAPDRNNIGRSAGWPLSLAPPRDIGPVRFAWAPWAARWIMMFHHPDRSQHMPFRLTRRVVAAGCHRASSRGRLGAPRDGGLRFGGVAETILFSNGSMDGCLILSEMQTLSGACVLYVLVWHLMGSAGCKVAWLKPQSIEDRSHATESAPSSAPSLGRRSRSGARVGLLSRLPSCRVTRTRSPCRLGAWHA
jgi:hypothetical protein